MSLSVIETVISDPDVHYCLYVGCYRNENKTEAIEQMITRAKSHDVNMFLVNLSPLDKESVNMLISESMCLPPSLSQPLSTILNGKCAGSPLFLRLFLSDGMIRFNLTTHTWDYDIRKIAMKEIPVELVQYLTSRMSQLPHSFRLVLKLASCLGDSFDAETFNKAKVKSDYDVDQVLPSVCQIGYIYEISSGKFIWAHDVVRHAAYALIPENMKEAFHLLIGTRMLMNTPNQKLKTSIFYILQHINQGIRIIESPEQKNEIAELNLLAGKLSYETSSFHSAAEYFMNGIALLADECFEHQYDLSIELHNAGQGALLATGDFAMLKSLSSKVLTRARCFKDKIPAYNNLIGYLISSGQPEDALILCSKVLDDLEEPLPAPIMDITIGMCVLELIKVKFRIGLKTEEKILNLPKMRNERKLILMDFLQCALSATPNVDNPCSGAILASRMVNLSLKYGLCDASSFAFALVGTCFLNSPQEDFKGAFFLADLAIKILHHLPRSNRFKARVFATVYGMVLIWRDPLQASLEKLLEGFNAGCCVGDQEYAYWNLLSYTGLALYTGQHLPLFVKHVMTCVKRGIQRQQIAGTKAIASSLAAAVKLAGSASKDDIYHLFNTTEDIILNEQKDRRCCMLIWVNRKFSFIYNGDMDGAVQSYKESLCHPFGPLARPLKTMPHIMSVFTDGLIGFFEARKHQQDEQKWSALGRRALEIFQRWNRLSIWNFSNKLHLLEAEEFFLKGNSLALEKYQASIAAAHDHHFTHEEGLAYSKLGCYHAVQGQDAAAKQCFKQADMCFRRWGAHCLAKQFEV